MSTETIIQDNLTSEPQEIVSINPATRQEIGSIPITPPEKIDEMFENARESQPQWASLSAQERGQKITAARRRLVQEMDVIGRLLAEETGKTNWEGFLEVFCTVEHMKYMTKKGPKALAKQSRSMGIFAHKKGFVQYIPHGVVGIISPWNYPLILTAGPVVEALMAGNAVILKPSELTPLTGQFIHRIFVESGIPESVLQAAYGFGATGQAIVESPKTDMICFTGSVEIGRKIAVACANRLKPVILELGGKDPMVVLNDANLERAASAAVWGGFANCGQTCTSVERVYVVDSVADTFINHLHDLTADLNTGPDKERDDIGALINERQHQKVLNHLREAVDKRADISIGGADRQNLGGYFIAPTIIENVDHNMDIMSRETFGPEIAVMRVKDEAEAVQMANATGYGLSASVFTRNKTRGKQIAKQLRAGSVCVNDVQTNYLAADLPFGGMGISGIGRVHGVEGLRSFSQTQAVLIDRTGFKKEAWWFPISDKTKSFFRWFTRFWYG